MLWLHILTYIYIIFIDIFIGAWDDFIMGPRCTKCKELYNDGTKTVEVVYFTDYLKPNNNNNVIIYIYVNMC